MEKKYFLVETGKDLDDFKEEICDLILNNKKIVIEHHELNKSGFLYEVRVGEDEVFSHNWWGKMDQKEKCEYLSKILFGDSISLGREEDFKKSN